MALEENWARVKRHRRHLGTQEIQGLADVLFSGQEPWLAEKLRSRNDQVLALKILGCLGRSGSIVAADLLLKSLEEKEEGIQLAAAAALKACPGKTLVTPLTQIMVRQGPASAKAGEVLVSYGDRGRDALWRLWFMEHAPIRLKAQVLRLLAEAGDKRSPYLAFLALQEEEEELVRAGLQAVESAGAVELWGNVASCLTHRSWRIRGRAALILGMLGEKRALPFLERMPAEADEWVEEERQKAVAILRRR